MLTKLDFPKKKQIPNFMKIRPVGAESFHANGGRKERHDEGNSSFSQFCERAYKRQETLT
jgi:hypothetical protein